MSSRADHLPFTAQKCNPWLTAAAVILPTFMEVMDTSIAAVALPYIAGSLSATVTDATWVLTSYLASNAVILPSSSWFALRFGRKRFLLFCIAVFTISSFACGSSTSMLMILIARAVQGAGGGALQPLSQAILLESFPPERRGQAMAAFGLGVVVAPILGPTLGGWLTDQYSWRWAFYINIPVGIIAILMISAFVTDPPYIRKAKVGRLDSIGLGLLAISLGTLQVVLDKGQEDDWFGATWIRIATVVIIAAFLTFLIRQLVTRNPIVQLKVFRNRNFALGCLLIALFGGAIYGLITLLPLFYQTLMGYSAATAGLAVSPRGLGAVVIMPIVGVMASRVDNRWMIAAGFALFGVAGLQFGSLTLNVSEWTLLWPIVISGVAAGMVFVPLTTVAVGTLSNEEIGNAAGLFNLTRNVGGSIGISTIDTLLARHEQIHRNQLVRNLTPLNIRFDHLFTKLQTLMSATSGPSVSRGRSYEILQRSLERQAAVWSYVDVFRYLALVSFLCIFVVFLLRAVKAERGKTTAAH